MKNFYADAYLNSILDVTVPFLREKGISGLILDIDNTLIGHNVPLPDENVLKHLRTLEDGRIKLCVVSNNNAQRVESFCEKIGISFFVASALKPRRIGYERAFKELGLPASSVAAVGDQVFTDVWGAKRVGCLAILTKPLHKGGEGFLIAVKRILEKPFIKR